MREAPPGATPNEFYILAGLITWVILTAGCFILTVIIMYILSVVFLLREPDMQFVLNFALWLNTAHGFLLALFVIHLIDTEKRLEIERLKRWK